MECGGNVAAAVRGCDATKPAPILIDHRHAEQSSLLLDLHTAPDPPTHQLCTSETIYYV
jgi:hypothetical protein